MGTMVATEEASAAAGRRIGELLDHKQASEAIRFAEECEGPQQITDQLRALAYTHGGAMMQDRARLESAVTLWRRAGGEKHNGIGYNLANAELDLWYLLVREHGYVAALQADRAHLRNALARRLAARLAEQTADQLTALHEGSPWMTFEEAVEYTRVPAGTFRKLSADGTFTAHGGKRKIYHRQELDAALLSLSGRTRR
jgi:hypothetical protein